MRRQDQAPCGQAGRGKWRENCAKYQQVGAARSAGRALGRHALVRGVQCGRRNTAAANGQQQPFVQQQQRSGRFPYGQQQPCNSSHGSSTRVASKGVSNSVPTNMRQGLSHSEAVRQTKMTAISKSMLMTALQPPSMQARSVYRVSATHRAPFVRGLVARVARVRCAGGRCQPV